jgi:hypothetical protein
MPQNYHYSDDNTNRLDAVEELIMVQLKYFTIPRVSLNTQDTPTENVSVTHIIIYIRILHPAPAIPTFINIYYAARKTKHAIGNVFPHSKCYEKKKN